MKFYGNGVVWDNMKSKVLCKFKNGEYEATDKYEIGYLLEKGYDNDGVQQEEIKEEDEEVEVGEIVNYEEMTNNELRSILEKRGHEGLDRKNKKQLLELIEGD